MQEVKVLNITYPKWVMMKEISKIGKKTNLTLIEISNYINVKREHPYFFEIMGYLIDERAIVHDRTIGGVKMLSINKKKLLKLIEETEIYQHFLDYVSYHKPFNFGVGAK